MRPSTVQAQADWQQALDAGLVQRLWRRAWQPGLLNAHQAQVLLARHHSMLPGSALAEALNRRANIAIDITGSQAPIVYAQPIAPSEVTTVIHQHLSSAMPSAKPELIMRETTVLRPSGSMSSDKPHTLPSTTAKKDVTPPLVVQRKAMTAQAAMPTSSMPQTTSLQRDAQSQPQHLQSSSIISTTESELIALPLASISPASTTPTTTAPNRLSPMQLQAQAKTSALPVVHAQRNQAFDQNGATQFVTWQSFYTNTATNGAMPLPVVREHIVDSGNISIMPSAQMRPTQSHGMSLPLAMPMYEARIDARPLGTSAPTPTIMAARQPAEAQRTAQIVAPSPFGGNPAQRAQATQSVDIDGIVDKVHRKFLRRLTNEAERRGVRA